MQGYFLFFLRLVQQSTPEFVRNIRPLNNTGGAIIARSSCPTNLSDNTLLDKLTQDFTHLVLGEAGSLL